MATELSKQYVSKIHPALMQELKLDNTMAVPQLKKVVISIGMGEAILDGNALERATEDIKKIAGQAPVTTIAKKSISNFKLREGMKIGLKVTLRGDRMYAFLERLFNIALPRVRDFRGVSPKAFDGKGNYNLGLREQIVFPEIEYDKIDKVRGMQITFVSTARTDEEGYLLLQKLGMPFRKN